METDGDPSFDSLRADIVLRNRRRDAQARERKFTMAVFGILAYSAFANGQGSLLLLGASPIDAAISFVLAVLYAFGAYRAWFKDDTRWWPVAIPAGLTIGLLGLAALAGVFRPIPLLLNIALLVLVPLRSRAVAASDALSPRVEA